MSLAAKGRSCCFTGHRRIAADARDVLRGALREVIGVLYEEGFRRFYTGGALGFDTIAALVVLDLREELGIELEVYIPCRDQEKMWTEKEKQYYKYIVSAADRTYCLSEYYTSSCMHARNRRMVDGSDCCVAFCKKNSGGTAYTVAYALKNDVRLINIADKLR